MPRRRATPDRATASGSTRKRTAALALAVAGAAVAAWLIDVVLELGHLEALAIFLGLFLVVALCDPTGAFDDVL
jgi:Flp pilus assembly protein TadB